MARNRKTLSQITAIEEPPVPDPARKEVADPKAKARRANGGGAEDPNAQPPGKDKVWGVASRDRWPDNSVNPNEDATTASEDDDGDDGEEQGGAALTKAELKAALDERGIEYNASASKAELVALYDGDDTGDNE